MRRSFCILIFALALVAPCAQADEAIIDCGAGNTVSDVPAVASASASIMGVSLDGIDGATLTPNGYVAVAGTVLKFHLRFTNTSDSGFNVVNAWIVSSPDGATWTTNATGNFPGTPTTLPPIGIDTTGLISKSWFPTVYSIRSFSSAGPTPILKADGISPDTVAFQGAGAGEGQGLPPHIDARHISILIKTNLADTGRSICIDTAMRCPPT